MREAGTRMTSAEVISGSKTSLMSSMFCAWSRKYGMAYGSATINPAVKPVMAVVGNKCWPLANCPGNTHQIAFWSCKKDLGRLRQVTCRLVGDCGGCPADSLTCEGLSGNEFVSCE